MGIEVGFSAPSPTDLTNPTVAGAVTSREGKAKAEKSSTEVSGDQVSLSADAQKEVAELKAVDQRVRAHEAAHLAAGGGVVTGGATYSFKQGPDGKRYAVGGEVPIDASAVSNNPRATMQKAQQIRSAALAPADPSPQDRKVAAQASVMEAKAAAELAKQSTAPLGKGFEAVV